MIGQKIQNYHVEELLGEGGMGTVYRAIDTVLQRTVAVKVLHPHLVRDATFFERFRNEAILSAKLSHPNVALLYNFFSEKNDNFMIMEFIDGFTLEKLLKQHGALPIDSVLKILIQTLDGLQHAHEKGILHRDIKPANLMLTKEGKVKLMDFGIARMIGSQRLTRVDRVVGTLEYMAPELLDGSEPTVQSDLYAIGVLMYELLSGKMPFEATTDATLITQILTKKPIPLRTRIKDLPKKIEEILETLLNKKPEKRNGSATDLRHILAGLVTPGLVIPQVLQTQKTVIPETQFHTKVNLISTQLVDNKAINSKSTTLEKVRSNLFSTEGLILSGAVILAILILFGGIYFLSPNDTISQKDVSNNTLTTQITVPITKKESEVIDFQTPPQVAEKPIKKEEEKPVKQKPKEEKTEEPVKKKEEENTKETPPSKPVVITPVDVPKEPEKEIVKPVVAATKITKKVSLRNISVALALDETISSNDPNIRGKSVALRVLENIIVDGIMVISAGTRANGIVTNARSSNDGKSFLEFKPERIQAVNGEWISLKSPSLGKSGSSIEAVIFTKGTRISPDPKTTNTTLILTL